MLKLDMLYTDAGLASEKKKKKKNSSLWLSLHKMTHNKKEVLPL